MYILRLLFCNCNLALLGNELDKTYKIKYLFKQKLFGINPSSVLQLEHWRWIDSEKLLLE